MATVPSDAPFSGLSVDINAANAEAPIPTKRGRLDKLKRIPVPRLSQLPPSPATSTPPPMPRMGAAIMAAQASSDSIKQQNRARAMSVMAPFMASSHSAPSSSTNSTWTPVSDTSAPIVGPPSQLQTTPPKPAKDEKIRRRGSLSISAMPLFSSSSSSSQHHEATSSSTATRPALVPRSSSGNSTHASLLASNASSSTTSNSTSANKFSAFANKVSSGAQNAALKVQLATQSAAAAMRNPSPQSSMTDKENPSSTSSWREKAANAFSRNGKGKDREASESSTSSSLHSPTNGSRSARMSAFFGHAASEGQPTDSQPLPSLVGPGHHRRQSTKDRILYGVRVRDSAGAVFGAPIRVAADRTKLSEEETAREVRGHAPDLAARRREACRVLPALAVRCLDYLNEYGKTEEGLYRIPGSSSEVNNLRAIFDSGADLDLLNALDVKDVEPSAVASCFKLWLRELPEPLLHNLDRQIDALLTEDANNTAQSQAMAMGAASPRLGASPAVLERIKDLFTESLPVENIVLLREIAYHLAHLDSFSSVNKMTFANLRLILSPTLKLSPVVLSLLVNERDRILPRPGELDLTARRPSQVSLFKSDVNLDEKLVLDYPKSSPPVLPMPATVTDEAPLPLLPQISPPRSTKMDRSTGSKGSGGSGRSYRASWHIIDLPRGFRRSNSQQEDEHDEHASTPIAKKFLKNGSSTNVLDRSLSSSQGSGGKVSHSPTSSINRAPTLSGRNSPSPFFSASVLTDKISLGHHRKRSSTSSIASFMQAVSPVESVRGFRHRRMSSVSSSVSAAAAAKPDSPPRKIKDPQEEEEELSSDTNTSACSSVSSAPTPKDSLDVPDIDVSPGIDTRRTTITEESFYRATRGADPSNKRGSMMILGLPDFSAFEAEDRARGLLGKIRE